jgi:hypothetical protein
MPRLAAVADERATVSARRSTGVVAAGAVTSFMPDLLTNGASAAENADRLKTPPLGNPSTRTTVGLGIVGVIGSAASVASLIVTLRQAKPPSGWVLVGLVLIPFTVITVFLVTLASQFRRQLTSTLDMHRSILNNLSDHHTTQLTEFAKKLENEVQQSRDQQTEFMSQLKSEQSYEQLTAKVGQAAHKLNTEAARHSTGIDQRTLVYLLRTTCQEVVRAMSEYGIPCRLCVKQVCEKMDEQSQEMRAYADTVCRDAGSSEDPVPHWIDLNTDFKELLFNDQLYWFCDDVKQLDGYANTSPQYRYRSVVVWPIIAKDSRSEGSQVIEPKTRGPVVAFLCMDSEEAAAFTEEAHVDLGWTIADAIARAFELHFITFANV